MIFIAFQGDGKLVFYDRVNFNKVNEISVENTVSLIVWSNQSQSIVSHLCTDH